jgi:malonyl-CoA O-methyltransferase
MLALDRVARLLRWKVSRRLPAQAGYALWAASYPPHPHNPLMEAEQSAVAPMIQAASPTRALDVGTGTGRYLPLLASAGATLIVGLDLSMPMLGCQLQRRPRVCADACRLPFPASSFDLICSSLMVGDVADLGAWIREATRVLAPGGHLVYSDFHPTWKQAGWRRTFRGSDGRHYELPYFPHTLEEHLARLEEAALVVRTIREPRVESRRAPMVIAFHASKPGPSTPQRKFAESIRRREVASAC